MKFSSMKSHARIAAFGAALGLSLTAGIAGAQPFNTTQPAQIAGQGTWSTTPAFTVGETVNGYLAPGILDGTGALQLDANTVRIFVNHELSANFGYTYALANGTVLDGARVSYFDFDASTRDLLDAGLAYDTVVDRYGVVVTAASQINEGSGSNPAVNGFDRFCAAWIGLAGQYGLVDDLFFTGEETSNGQEFAVDVANGVAYAVPALGRAAFESVTMLQHPDPSKVAVIIGDDRAPAPMLLFIGEKDHFGTGDVLDRNGLASGQGTLYAWVSDSGFANPDDFNGTGNSTSGTFVPVAYYDPAMAGMAGYDLQGYASQSTQDAGVAAVSGFLFSRPEDVATNPADGTQFVLASTGRGSLFAADNWGALYVFDVDFSGANPTATIDIVYDGDDAGAGQFAGPDFGLRSPDNLEWSSNGIIYVQEDRSTSPGSLFGGTSGEEASIWAANPLSGVLTRIAQVDRSAIPAGQTDIDPTDLGDWETSGVIDVTGFFATEPTERLLFVTAQAHSLRGGVIDTEGLVQGGQLLFLSNDEATFRLTLLHNNDGESELLPSGDTGGIARFVATIERERSSVVAPDHGVLTLSSGDNFLAGPEFNAGVSNGIPFYDTIALEKVGYDAIALGNHDFDFGPDVLVDFLAGYTTPQTYLSSNLDFTAEPGLQAFVNAGVIGKSTVVTVAGQQVGIIGATTTNLPFISSPRNVVVNAVAAAVQTEVANLLTAGVDKIVLISHLQSVLEDLALQAQLQDIDIVVAGGGDELLANPGTDLLPGDSAQGGYPLFATDFTGKQIPVVTTSGNYRYVGRLVVDFDAAGEIVAIDVAGSGPVRVVGNTFPDGVTPDPLCEALIEQPVTAALAAQASNVLAVSQVALDGLRSSVRTMETNQGNLVTDAMRYVANTQAAAFGLPLADVALQNGGGMRDDAILPPGDVTELNTFDILPFANFVSVVPNVPREQFKEILENAVSRVEFGDGRFAQVSGMSMIWDEDGQAQLLDNDGNVTVPGSRVYEVMLSDGTPIVSAGMVVPGADLTVATIDFLARGGDRYPYRGAAFTSVGFTYQQALQEYLVAGLGSVVTALAYPEGGEGRIQTLRSVSVLDPREEQPGTAPVLRNVVLAQNAPNPFNPSTRIDFALPADATVSLVVYDVKGRRVATLVDGSIEAGDHSVVWQGTDDTGKPISSGLYFYVLDNGTRRITKSMSLVK